MESSLTPTRTRTVSPFSFYWNTQSSWGLFNVSFIKDMKPRLTSVCVHEVHELNLDTFVWYFQSKLGSCMLLFCKYVHVIRFLNVCWSYCEVLASSWHRICSKTIWVFKPTFTFPSQSRVVSLSHVSLEAWDSYLSCCFLWDASRPWWPPWTAGTTSWLHIKTWRCFLCRLLPLPSRCSHLSRCSEGKKVHK